MPRAAKEVKKENKEKEIEEKLQYLGLNLDKIPKVLLKDEEIKYRPAKQNDETSYKVYKYVDIKQLDILITPSERLDDLTNKFQKADYLSSYLQPDDDIESMQKNAVFMRITPKIGLKKITRIRKKARNI